MKYSRTVLLILVLIAIIGAIAVLESKKAGPTNTPDTRDSIEVEEVFEVENEDKTESTVSETSESEQDIDSKSDVGLQQSKDEGSEKKVISKTRADIIAEKAGQYERAKEISTPDHFINTEPLTVQELIGEKVILVDFWTYSCINCQRTTPYLNSWYDKYADGGFVILGIHTPEFEFEKDVTNVERATEALGIKYPVIMDNDYSTWGAYKNRYWPRKYLIDIDGFIVYDHIGEGGYEETEAKIVELLNEKNNVLGMETKVALEVTKPEDVDEVDFTKVKTRESYFGSTRLEYLANLPDDSCFDTICNYELSVDVPPNLFALEGEWRIDPENAVLTNESGSILSHFEANKVNLVAGSEKPVAAEIFLDGEPISSEFAGSDVMDGKVIFKEHTLYNLVDLRGDYGEHTVEVRFEEKGISAFAFTFG